MFGSYAPVHIRLTDNTGTYCGAAGESMSLAHWLHHVVPNRDGCCRVLFARLCRDCDMLIPFALHAEET